MFWNQVKKIKEKERAGERKREWELDLLGYSWMREKKKIKEGGDRDRMLDMYGWKWNERKEK